MLHLVVPNLDAFVAAPRTGFIYVDTVNRNTDDAANFFLVATKFRMETEGPSMLISFSRLIVSEQFPDPATVTTRKRTAFFRKLQTIIDKEIEEFYLYMESQLVSRIDIRRGILTSEPPEILRCIHA